MKKIKKVVYSPLGDMEATILSTTFASTNKKNEKTTVDLNRLL